MSTFTLRYRTRPSDAAIARVADIVQRRGGTIAWRHNEDEIPTYALIENADDGCAVELAAVVEAEIADGPIIALAVSPQVPQAMPLLEHALAGPGAPVALDVCRRSGDALLLEWNLDRLAAPTLLALVDVELARVRSGRTTRLVAPIPLIWWTRIASHGLAAPDVVPERVLEFLLEQRGVAD